MKKLFAIILCVAMLLSMSACGSDPTSPTVNVTDDTHEKSTIFNLFSNNNAHTSDPTMEKAARLSADINGPIPPSEEYWQTCMDFLINEVDRDDWASVLRVMEWGSNGVNVVNVEDVADISHKYFAYTDGHVEFLHYGLWHTPIWSHNIFWNKSHSTYSAKLHDNTKPGYILMQNPGWGIYIIELTTSYPTTLTTLSQPSNSEYNVDGPWVKDMVDETELNKQLLFATGREYMDNMTREENMSNQEYWNEFMTYVVENIPNDLWHEFFTECNGWSYAGDEYYGYTDINRLNILDNKSYYGSVEQWSFDNNTFTIPAHSYHYVEWSYNINWDVDPSDYRSDRHATLADSTKSGVILLLFGDYYYHIVELTNDSPTQLTSLAQDFDSEWDILFWDTQIIIPTEQTEE